METYRCPRCNLPMDEGHISLSGSNAGYVSNKQTGMLRKAAPIRKARGCPNCGYVELYVEPKELKQNIS
jgi:predicted nucleic-acid-binding Zn-ribbon protein